MPTHIIITIDGTAGSDKSAGALELALQLDLPHLDTGAMCRAVAMEAQNLNVQNARGLRFGLFTSKYFELIHDSSCVMRHGPKAVRP